LKILPHLFTGKQLHKKCELVFLKKIY